MSARTMFPARLVGFCCILIGLTLVARGEATPAAMRYAQLFYLYLAVDVLCGLCLVLAAAQAERFTFRRGVAVEVLSAVRRSAQHLA